jgi:hypothetical protein
MLHIEVPRKEYSAEFARGLDALCKKTGILACVLIVGRPVKPFSDLLV